MELNIVKEVAVLQRLSMAQLRQRYAELFGEATAALPVPFLESGNRAR